MAIETKPLTEGPILDQMHAFAKEAHDRGKTLVEVAMHRDDFDRFAKEANIRTDIVSLKDDPQPPEGVRNVIALWDHKIAKGTVELGYQREPLPKSDDPDDF